MTRPEVDVIHTRRTGVYKYDSLPAMQAVIMAWSVPGLNPQAHAAANAAIRKANPILARALDRAVKETNLCQISRPTSPKPAKK